MKKTITVISLLAVSLFFSACSLFKSSQVSGVLPGPPPGYESAVIYPPITVTSDGKVVPATGAATINAELEGRLVPQSPIITYFGAHN